MNDLQLLTTQEFNGHVLDCYVESEQENMITPKGLKYLTDKLIVNEYPLLVLIEQKGVKRLKKHDRE